MSKYNNKEWCALSNNEKKKVPLNKQPNTYVNCNVVKTKNNRLNNPPLKPLKPVRNNRLNNPPLKPPKPVRNNRLNNPPLKPPKPVTYPPVKPPKPILNTLSTMFSFTKKNNKNNNGLTNRESNNNQLNINRYNNYNLTGRKKNNYNNKFEGTNPLANRKSQQTSFLNMFSKQVRPKINPLDVKKK
jgi:hypothetical protein